MDTLKTFWNTLLENVLAEFIVVVVGVLFVQRVQRWWLQHRFGRWQVRILRQGETLMSRKISARKAKEILEEPADLSVFLKGVVSPYAWVTCDIIEEGRRIGLLQEDRKNRIFTIDLDKNCPDERREGALPAFPG